MDFVSESNERGLCLIDGTEASGYASESLDIRFKLSEPHPIEETIQARQQAPIANVRTLDLFILIPLLAGNGKQRLWRRHPGQKNKWQPGFLPQ